MKIPFFRGKNNNKLNLGKSYILEDYNHFKKIIDLNDDIKYFFYFYQENCNECKKSSKIINSLMEKNDKVKFILLNTNTTFHLKIFKKFGVDYAPRYLLLKNKEKKSKINNITNENNMQIEIDKI